MVKNSFVAEVTFKNSAKMTLKRILIKKTVWPLTISWRMSLSYRNQSIDLQSKSMDWFLYDRDLRHERAKMLVSLLSNILGKS